MAADLLLSVLSAGNCQLGVPGDGGELAVRPSVCCSGVSARRQRAKQRLHDTNKTFDTNVCITGLGLFLLHEPAVSHLGVHQSEPRHVSVSMLRWPTFSRFKTF